MDTAPNITFVVYCISNAVNTTFFVPKTFTHFHTIKIQKLFKFYKQPVPNTIEHLCLPSVAFNASACISSLFIILVV